MMALKADELTPLSIQSNHTERFYNYLQIHAEYHIILHLLTPKGLTSLSTVLENEILQLSQWFCSCWDSITSCVR